MPLDQGIIAAGVYTAISGAGHHHFVNPKWQGHYGVSYYSAGEATRIYADAGTTVFASVKRSSDVSRGEWKRSISGYLVNAP